MAWDPGKFLKGKMEDENAQTDRVYELPLEDVARDPKQPRKVFSEEGLNDLAEDLKLHGLIQPIVVRFLKMDRFTPKYQIVTGERRWRAAKKAGFKTIRAVVMNTADKRIGFVQMAENMKRENLSIAEIAEFIRSQLPADYDNPKSKDAINAVKQAKDEVAEALGIDGPDLSRYLSYFSAPDYVQEAVKSGKIATLRPLADLTHLLQSTPEEAETIRQWLENTDLVTQRNIRELKVSFRSAEPETDISSDNPDEKTPQDAEAGEDDDGGSVVSDEAAGSSALAYTEKEKETAARREQEERNAAAEDAADALLADKKPIKLRHPLLIAQWVDQDGVPHQVELLLVKPDNPGFGHVRSSEEGLDLEVPLENLKLQSLTEG